MEKADYIFELTTEEKVLLYIGIMGLIIYFNKDRNA